MTPAAAAAIALAGAAAALALAGPAAAQTEPRPCSAARDADARVRCVVAAPGQVVLLNAERGASLLIEIPDGERITAVPASDNQIMRGARAAGARLAVDGGGDDDDPEARATADAGLSVAVRSNTVVLKPNADLVQQPFFVVAERDGKPVRYRFQLQTVARAEAYYSVALRDAAAEQAEQRERWQQARARREEREARDRLAQAAAAPCAAARGVNLRYTGVGERALAPAEVCDDGRRTFLRFPGAQRVPVVYVTLADGREAQVDAVPGADGWLAVGDRSRRLVLREGGRVLCLINHGYDAVGRTTGTGTVAADVVLEPREPARREPREPAR